jgi:hypothetical protein
VKTSSLSIWVTLVAQLINLGIATEEQIATLLHRLAGASDTDPDIQAEIAASMRALRFELAELRARAAAEATRQS